MIPIVLDEPLMLVVKATLLLAVGGLLAVAARQATASLRHLLWTATLLGLLALPLLSLGLPGWTVPVLPAEMQAGSPGPDAQPRPMPLQMEEPLRMEVPFDAAVPAAPAAPTAPPARTELMAASQTDLFLPHPLILLWIAGALGVLGWIALGQIGVMRLRRSASAVRDPEWLKETHDLTWILDISRPVALLRGVGMSTPMTWGMIWPTVLLPSEAEDWTAERRRMVLLHELAHVKRKDCLTQLVAHLACAVFWFHPLVWYAARRLRVEREQACDDLVVRTGSPAADYADHLLHVARSLRAPRAAGMAIAMARPSQLEGRLLAVLDDARRREDGSATVRIGMVAAVLLLAVPLAAVQPGPAAAGEAALEAHAWGESGDADASGHTAEPEDVEQARSYGMSEDLHWQGSMRPGGTLAIYTMNGPVQAVGVRGATARISGRARALRSRQLDVRLEAIRHDGNVTVCILPVGSRCTTDGIRGHQQESHGPRTVELTVEVPEGVALHAETLNGALAFDAIRSNVHALTLNGAIQASASGYIEAKTLNGAIDVTMARTDWTGDLALETLNGAIRVRLPDDASTRVQARTMSGRIVSDFPLEVSRRPGASMASGTIGRGGRSLDLSTMNGAIRIDRAGGALPGAVSTADVPLERDGDGPAGFAASMEAFGEAMGALGEEIGEAIGESIAEAFDPMPEPRPMPEPPAKPRTPAHEDEV